MPRRNAWRCLTAGDKDGRHELALPAYDQCIKASHVFNLLDARGVISVTERQAYILRVRELAKAAARLGQDRGRRRGMKNMPTHARRRMVERRILVVVGREPFAMSPGTPAVCDGPNLSPASTRKSRKSRHAIELMPELLLELFSEEIPARMQARRRRI